MATPSADPAQLAPLAEAAAALNIKDSPSSSAFFYGTLMHPKILCHVLQNDGSHLTVCPAILFDHIRFHIKHADYPAVISADAAPTVIGYKVLSDDERTVRGVLVHGLTQNDLGLLDLFEGDEYAREEVKVAALSSPTPLTEAQTKNILAESTSLPDKSSATTPTSIYIWSAPLWQLSPDIWSYDVFVRDRLAKWIAKPHTDGTEWAPWEDYENETDRRRNMQGVIVAPTGGEGNILKVTDEKKPDMQNLSDVKFGHGMLKYFSLSKGYINLNNGSYGSPPLAVTEWCEKMSRLAEERPDKWFRFEYQAYLEKAREGIARLVKANKDEIVIVPNVTHGINTILHNLEFDPEDLLVGFSTTYYGIDKTMRYFSERSPHPKLSTVQLTFPTSHDEIVERFKEHMANLPKPTTNPYRKIVVVIDGVISNPGVRLPWERMVQVCSQYGAISIVDGAHGIGMEDINLERAQPDFWTSNCHKWMFTKRGCAALYVARRNHRLIRTSFPTSWGYVSPPDTQGLAELFEWTGTVDLSPMLSVNAALEFRESIGGEGRIRDYIHSLAVEGGKRMAEILGTEMMESPKHELTAAMANVRLPVPSSTTEGTMKEQLAFLARTIRTMIDDYNCMAALYIHDGKLWVRASAQIWNEVSDFEYTANVLKDLCNKGLK